MNKDTAKDTVAKNTQSVETAVSTEQPKVDETKMEERKQSPLELAKAEVAKYGFNGKMVATSYGHSKDGFLIVEGGKGIRMIEVDRKNNRAVEILHWTSLSEFARQKNETVPAPMIVKFAITNDIHDRDENSGVWDGNKHILPIYGLYEWDTNGNVVPKMLYTGGGENPGHYHGVLYEQKNVDMMNIFLTEAIPLLDNARKNNVLL